MENNRYFLDKSSKKFFCPNCGKKTFVKYVDSETGDYVDDSCGRCDRENNCHYHLPPRDFFDKNPGKKPIDSQQRDYAEAVVPAAQQDGFLFMSNNFKAQKQDYSINNLFRALTHMGFPADKMTDIFDRYFVRNSKHWVSDGGKAVGFPQIDLNGQVRQIQVIAFNPLTAKRLKADDPAMLWNEQTKSYAPDCYKGDKVWFAGKSLLIKSLGKDAAEKVKLTSTFFGCHLLGESYDGRPVALVESAKTALCMSFFCPGFLWLATNGCNGTWYKNGNYKPLLRASEVRLMPDSGEYSKWCEIARVLRGNGVKVHSVSNECEKFPANTDILDVYLKRWLEVQSVKQQEIAPTATADDFSPEVQEMRKANPALDKLINTFGLVEV